ncbi:PASTA domain-containing protein [Streptomyces rectiverticillatus]|uniref:PASTA domain-containing protein n=1 Tax=Streptomyces rectiverticillatus TaxID=173860 RepID=UPI0015C3E446|nr:PASTA domain-containing protein [Streptomyces rectiverticillatus]QLE75447.1 PASTA domain-containing protein [Streptomyces rectiverticillatus]
MPGPQTTPAPSDPPHDPEDASRQRTPWSKRRKIVTAVAAVAVLGAVLPDLSDQQKETARDTAADAKAVGTKQSRGTQHGAAAASASAAPGTAEPTRPPAADYRGQNLDVAYGKARKAGFVVNSHDASEKNKFIRGRTSWTVCFQETGRPIGTKPTLDFGVVPKDAPCPKEDGRPIPWPTMPELVWKTWRTARAEAIALGVPAGRIEARKAYRNDKLPGEGEYDDWRVCAHDPAEGAKVESGTRVTLYLSSKGNGCPEPDRGNGTSVDLPDRDRDGDPDYRDPFPGDRNRNTAFPDGIPRLDDSGGSGGSSGGSHGGGRIICRHTRLC